MKTKLPLSTVLIFCFVLKIHAQVQINQGFIDPFNPLTNGWVVQNNSIPLGTTSWSQGSPATFPSFSGGPSDYFCCNFNSQGNTSGAISNFLISPTVSIINGAVLEFATRTTTAGTWPDRLQVRLSMGTNSAIPSGTNSIGSYTNMILDINPNLTTSTSSVVSGGIVNGYPSSWALYSLTLTGISNPGTGRIAFRYFVDNGGFNGPNSDYIGLDAVKYTVFCGILGTNFTVCANSTVTLNPTGGIAPVNYTWNPGGINSSSIVVTPTATTVYTLSYTEASNSCPNQTFTVGVGSQLSAIVAASSSSVCAGQTVQLSVSSPASTYSWSNGSNSSVTTVTPSPPSTTYSVGVSNGLCFGGNTITINATALPNPSIAVSPANVCPNATMSLIGSGVSSYSWSLNNSPMGTSSSSMVLTQPNSKANTTQSFVLTGSDASGCVGSTSVNVYVQPITTLVISASSSVVCASNEFTLTVSGADTYTWSSAGTGNSNPAVFTASSSPGSMFFNVAGTNSLGCNGTTNKAITVADCVGIQRINSAQGDVSVFPNPFHSEINIKDFEGTVNVYNAIGQLLISQTVNHTSVLNTSDLQKGSYLIFFVNPAGKTSGTMKLMKN